METKTNLKPETVELVRDLIRINADSRKGFEEAAEAIDSPAYAQLFRKIASIRAGHVTDLSNLVETTDERDGSFKGKMHRWWLQVRGGVQGGSPHAILAEAERGEDEIKARYEKLLKDEPGTAVSDVLHRQLAEVKQHHDQIRDLRDAEKERS